MFIFYMGSYNVVKVVVVLFFEIMKLELVFDNIDVSVVCLSFFKMNLDELMWSSNLVLYKMFNKFFVKVDMMKEDVVEFIF